jgi:hypothetical protein
LHQKFIEILYIFRLYVLEEGKQKRYDSSEALDILLVQRDDASICSRIPVRTQNNSSYLVDLSKLTDEKDVTVDDNGVYLASTGRIVHVYWKGHMILHSTREQYKPGYTHAKLTKLLGTSRSSPDFHRTIFCLLLDDGTYFRYCLVQYHFDGLQHTFPVLPHGNAKGNTPYKQTCQSVRDHLKAATKISPPSAALRKVNKDLGTSMSSVISTGEMPRGEQQAKYYRQRNSLKQQDGKDKLGKMMEECKRTMGTKASFIRRVNAAPEPMCVIGTNQSFAEVNKFCIQPGRYRNSVLTVDPTFDLGDFLFTPTVYRNTALQHRRTGTNPFFIGPALIHYRKYYTTYHYFASTIVGEEPSLSGLLAFGTDGERNLYKSWETVFTKADHLRCTNHSKRNVDRKSVV